ncbi:MAG: universal stress protein [Spirochaetales bacterium]|nr:universal stress protein [Spirochaetales bacterium]
MDLYRKILLTIDLSSADDAVMDHVCSLAKIHRSEVVLLHVVHSHTLDQHRFMTDKAAPYLDEKKARLEKEGIPAGIIMRHGEPEKEILKEIDGGSYDLVAIGTHGHGFFLDFLFGSVSDCIKHKTNIPVLLIRGE